MKSLDYILGILDMAAQFGGAVVPGGAKIAGLADYFLQIAQKAVAAHEAITGQPLDLSKLHEIQKV